jgi:hypothetical protein
VSVSALRKSARRGFPSGLLAPELPLRLVRISESGVELAESSQPIGVLIDLLRRVKARKFLRVADRKTFDDHPSRLVGIAWLKVGHAIRREIRTTLNVNAGQALVVFALSGAHGYTFQFSVQPANEPVRMSHDLLQHAQLALLEAEGTA